MNYSFDDKKRAFHFLDGIVDLEINEICKYYSDENLKNIEILQKELTDDKTLPESLSAITFSEILFYLSKTHKNYGKKLGEALISADDKDENHDIDASIVVLEKFAKNCTSPFHRTHAQKQINYYKEKKARKKK